MSATNTQNNNPPKRKTDTDWTTLRLEYINGTLSLRDLARKHGVTPSATLARSARENWEEQRKQLRSSVISVAQEKLTEEHIDKLSEFNAEDIKAAEAIRKKAYELLPFTTDNAGLRALAGALAEAQKIGRLALGAETANTKTTGKMDLNVAQPEDITHILAEMEQMATKATVQ